LALRAIPVIAIVPFGIMAFGLGDGSRIFIIGFGVFFQVWIGTHLGMQHIRRHFIWVAESLGATHSQIFTRVLLPASLNHVIAAMRTALATAFICLVAAEMAGASSGLGYRIEASHLAFQSDRMIAALAVLGVVAALCDQGFAA